MSEITLDEMIAEVQEKEQNIKEPSIVTEMIQKACNEVFKAAKSGNVKVLTDYDADGICAAYIMRQTLLSVNPNADISVVCNDRRNSYGLSPNIQGDGKSAYIVLDMGSNQLDLIKERLGENTIVFDHHLIADEKDKQAFKEQSNLLNPHCLTFKDGKTSEYCATGLAYRAYQELEGKMGEKFIHNEKQDNTIAAIACIGTCTDMVNVMDMYGYNRQIIKNGIDIINKADETNFDFVIGNMLVKNGITEAETNAHQLAFNVGAYLNAASRMSEIIAENGAQIMFDTLTGSESRETFIKIADLCELNSERKTLIDELVTDTNYQDFVHEERFKDNNIAIYILPDNTPSSFAGLIAGKLAEATDKAIICLTYNTEKECYTGSGRNTPDNTSLMDFMKIATLDTEGKLDIKYGGHEDAIGISYLNDISLFKDKVDRNAFEMERKDISDKTVLNIDLSEVSSPETLDKLKALEPLGVGLQIPPVKVEGQELRRNVGHLKGRDDWKNISVKGVDAKISDWSYQPEIYPQSGKKNNEIALLADISISSFRGEHTELTAHFDRSFLQSRIKEIEKDKPVEKSK